MVPYKIDTGSYGNIKPLHMYKKLFPSVTNEKSATTKNKCPIKTYNKTTITQLGMCTVIVEHNNNKKNVDFWWCLGMDRHCWACLTQMHSM